MSIEIKHDKSDMKIIRGGSQSSPKGPPEWFTGDVRIDPLVSADDGKMWTGLSTCPTTSMKLAALCVIERTDTAMATDLLRLARP